ncbi:MAG: NUDIX hydrolase [Bacteroidota bacterium]
MICIYVNSRKIVLNFHFKDTKKTNSFQINDLSTLKNITKKFLEGEINTDEIHLQGDTNTIYNNFIYLYPQINAAGGAVFNPKKELLMIYRRGFWDLPKGKTEPDESVKQSAKREVEEETGIKGTEIIQALPDTYHMYLLDNQWVTKRTRWFHMSADNQPLKPQTEEDIELVQWVNIKDSYSRIKQTYDSLKPVIQAAINKIETENYDPNSYD